MVVRAKFRLTRFETSKTTRNGSAEKVEVRNLFFMAVYDGSEENKKFFAFTPNGEIKLSTVNPEAWSQFELDKEYYVDFTPAE